MGGNDLSDSPGATIPIEEERLRGYLWWSGFWVLLLLILFPPFILAWIAWILGWGRWYARRYVELYSARLEEKRIRIRQGVIVQRNKAIPLDRVTDVLISQGFLERRFGLCQIRIQTAGTGAAGVAEGTVPGLLPEAAERLQEQIIEARDRYSERSSS